MHSGNFRTTLLVSSFANKAAAFILVTNLYKGDVMYERTAVYTAYITRPTARQVRKHRKLARQKRRGN